MSSSLKTKITDDMKLALKAKEQKRLSVIRLIMAAMKQKEVDERIELDDSQVIAVLEKMRKQRQESLRQYKEFNRPDLAEQEEFEIQIIEGYLPAAMSESELLAFIDQAIKNVEAQGPQDMGKVMAYLKKEAQGRIDMAVASQKIKEKLSS